MKSLMQLASVALNELGDYSGISTARDWKTITRRVEDEGLSFLTITLPAFAKDFFGSLERGDVRDSSCFLGFKKHGYLPRFLGGFTSLVFDRSSGSLLDAPDVGAISAIRQFCLMFQKIEFPTDPVREKLAFDQYIKTDLEVAAGDLARAGYLYDDLARASLCLFGQLFSDLDLAVAELEIVPKHGPGATADRIRGNAKFEFNEWPERLESYFPSWEFAIPSPRYLPHLDHVSFLPPERERPVRVISVPKTLKTPRIIAIEPTVMQYAQQALLVKIMDLVDQDKILANVVGFRDQARNQELARDGSLFGELATLDLSEASDRVSNHAVLALLRHWPHLSGFVQATRSSTADVPGHGVHTIAKFASMGSALCFPVETLLFVAISFIGHAKHRGIQMNRSEGLRFLKSGSVSAFGDDIIVKAEIATTVIETLEAYGLKVNRDKSFWNGKFRESCGGDFFDGCNITPIRMRRPFPESQQNVQEIVSLVSFRNQLYGVGLWRSAAFLDSKLERLLLGAYPVVEPSSPVLGRHSVSFEPMAEKIDRDLHIPLVKGYVQHSNPPVSRLGGVGSLLKVFVTGFNHDPRHLERSGRPTSARLKRRWAPVR